MLNLSPSRWSICSFGDGEECLWKFFGLTSPHCQTSLSLILFWGNLDYDYDYDDGDVKVFDSYQACPPTLVPWVRESYRQQWQCRLLLIVLGHQWEDSAWYQIQPCSIANNISVRILQQLWLAVSRSLVLGQCRGWCTLTFRAQWFRRRWCSHLPPSSSSETPSSASAHHFWLEHHFCLHCSSCQSVFPFQPTQTSSRLHHLIYHHRSRMECFYL